MNCRQAEEVLDAFVDAELDEAAMREAQAHVAGCAACARQVGTRQDLGGLLNRTLSASAAESVDFEGLWASVQAGITDSVAGSSPSARQRATRARTADRARAAGRFSPHRSQRAASTRQGGRRWRIPAVSAGALAAAALGFIFLSTENESNLGQLVQSGSDDFVEAQPRPSPRLLASAGGEDLGLGPVAPREEELASYWPAQVQPGPVRVSSHANAVWRQRTSR